MTLCSCCQVVMASLIHESSFSDVHVYEGDSWVIPLRVGGMSWDLQASFPTTTGPSNLVLLVLLGNS